MISVNKEAPTTLITLVVDIIEQGTVEKNTVPVTVEIDVIRAKALHDVSFQENVYEVAVPESALPGSVILEVINPTHS